MDTVIVSFYGICRHTITKPELMYSGGNTLKRTGVAPAARRKAKELNATVLALGPDDSLLAVGYVDREGKAHGLNTR